MTLGCWSWRAGGTCRQPWAAHPPACPVHDRFMIKRAQGRKRFGMKNFKKRWFRLTNHEFTYQKSKGNKNSSLFICFHIFYNEGPEPCLGPGGGTGCFSGVGGSLHGRGAPRGWPGHPGEQGQTSGVGVGIRVSGWTLLSRVGGSDLDHRRSPWKRGVGFSGTRVLLGASA